MITKFVRKRTILAVILTLAVLFVTNKYWLIFNPFPMGFNIMGVGNCNIIVLLNQEDNEIFKNVKSDHQTVNTEDNSYVDINKSKSRSHKRVKLIFSNVEKNIPITLSTIYLGNNKLNSNEINKFVIDGASKVVSNDKLTLTPFNNIVSVTYPKTLDIKTHINFDVMIFIIITVLTYMLAYQLSNYVAEFNSVQGKSKIDIVFLVIFFVSLFIPFSYISNAEISPLENRPLAKWQPLILGNNEINFNFGTNFNQWYNDRFYLRQQLVGIYHWLTFHGKNDVGFVDKNTGFLYSTVEFKYIKLEHVKECFNILYKFNNWCKEHNIKLYVLLVPPKAEVYKTDDTDVIDLGYHKEFLDYYSSVKAEYPELSIVYPFEELLKGKNDNYMFFKTEHHWTDDGAFVAYQELMKKIVKDFPDVKQLTANDFNYSYNNLVRGDFIRVYDFGTTSKNMGLLNLQDYHKDKYRYYTHKDFNSLSQQVINTDHHMGKYFHYPNGANHRVIMLGTSQNENLTEFIPFTFKDVKRLRNNSVQGIGPEEEFKIMKYYEKEMLAYKPDIIILCIAYQNLYYIKDFFNME